MTYEQILEALTGLVSLGMQEISLDGGEPLTHPRIQHIVSWLRDRSVLVRMNSNGILVPRRVEVVRHLDKLKISLDGPPEIHDGARGPRAFERAVAGAEFARSLGVPVEFTCVLGQHNREAVDAIVDLATERDFPIVFQPARDSLFNEDLVQLGRGGPGSGYKLRAEQVQRAFSRVEHHKRRGANVANTWASLRHFRSFPRDTRLPCAAGWINLTMDPEGNLFHCGQVSRRGLRNNVVELGVTEAFRRLTREPCGQCWCARVVEENYAWGGRLDRFLPSVSPEDAEPQPAPSVARG